MAFRGDAFEREGGAVPDIVKQFVVYLYRHIRCLLPPAAVPPSGSMLNGPAYPAGSAIYQKSRPCMSCLSRSSASASTSRHGGPRLRPSRTWWTRIMCSASCTRSAADSRLPGGAVNRRCQAVLHLRGVPCGTHRALLQRSSRSSSSNSCGGSSNTTSSNSSSSRAIMLSSVNHIPAATTAIAAAAAAATDVGRQIGTSASTAAWNTCGKQRHRALCVSMVQLRWKQ